METSRFFDAELKLFLALLVAVTSVFLLGLFWTDNYWIFMSTGYMWSPAIAIILTKTILKKEFDLHLGWNSWKHILGAYPIPLIYCLAIYGTAMVLGYLLPNMEYLSANAERFNMGADNLGFLLVFIVLKGGLGTLGNLSSSFGEELGWRGYLYPKFRSKFGFVASTLMVGAIWAIWHYPLILKNTLGNSEINTLRILLTFTIVIILVSFVYSWFFERSGSVWSAVILHSAHNSFMGGTFDNIYIDRGAYVGETGLITILVLFFFAMGFTFVYRSTTVIKNV